MFRHISNQNNILETVLTCFTISGKSFLTDSPFAGILDFTAFLSAACASQARCQKETTEFCCFDPEVLS